MTKHERAHLKYCGRDQRSLNSMRQLIAEGVAQQLEKRVVMFRRAMKRGGDQSLLAFRRTRYSRYRM